MARLTIEDLATGYPHFRISVRTVSGKRLYHLDHGPSRKGTACLLRTLADVESVILGFARDQHNTGYWRPECFLAGVDLPAGEQAAPSGEVAP